jgi:hypothetical protein
VREAGANEKLYTRISMRETEVEMRVARHKTAWQRCKQWKTSLINFWFNLLS